MADENGLLQELMNKVEYLEKESNRFKADLNDLKSTVDFVRDDFKSNLEVMNRRFDQLYSEVIDTQRGVTESILKMNNAESIRHDELLKSKQDNTFNVIYKLISGSGIIVLLIKVLFKGGF